MTWLWIVLTTLAALVWTVGWCLWFHDRGFKRGHTEGYGAGYADGETAGRTKADNWWLDAEEQATQARRMIG